MKKEQIEWINWLNKVKENIMNCENGLEKTFSTKGGILKEKKKKE